MNIDDKAWFAELYIAVEMRCRPDLDDIDAANIVTCIESLLAENERLNAELAKYRDAQKYGCHCDLEDHMEPDGCVIDTGNLNDCVYAKRYKSKEQCQYWRTIQIVKPGE